MQDEDIAHLSPARYEHINPYGKYHFDIEQRFRKLRPLRSEPNRRVMARRSLDLVPLLLKAQVAFLSTGRKEEALTS